MKGSAILATLACVMFVRAEPPAPNSNYLPPQSRPSSQYGTPAFGGSAPSSQYGAPSNQYIPPSSNGFHGGNNNNQYQQSSQSSYNAPTVTSAIFKQPSSQYGAPSQNGYNGGASGSGYSAGGASGSGYSNGGYENNEPAKYSFEYNVQDYPSGNDFGHMESRDGDRTVGRYYVLLPDGRKQIVNYEADQNGYRPTITYEDTNAGANNNGYNNNGGGYNSNAQQQSNKFNGY